MTTHELRVARQALGYTQNQLAEALGVNRVTVARWECGMRKISALAGKMVTRLCADHMREAHDAGEI